MTDQLVERIRAAIVRMGREAFAECLLAEEVETLLRDAAARLEGAAPVEHGVDPYGVCAVCGERMRGRLHWGCWSRAPAEGATPATGLTFAEFSRANRARCESPQGFNHQLSAWSTSDWITALVGEVGEAANVVKKLNRYRDGVPGNKASEAELRAHLRKECGDAGVYLDLLCQSLGFSLVDAMVEVFNAKSADIGYPVTLPATGSPASGGHDWSLGDGICLRCGIEQAIAPRVCSQSPGASAPPSEDGRCDAAHESGAHCELPRGHAENHRGPFRHGIAQWPA